MKTKSKQLIALWKTKVSTNTTDAATGGPPTDDGQRGSKKRDRDEDGDNANRSHSNDSSSSASPESFNKNNIVSVDTPYCGPRTKNDKRNKVGSTLGVHIIIPLVSRGIVSRISRGRER